MILLSFTLLFWVQVYTPFLCFLSREDPLAFVGEQVWWCWILSGLLEEKILIFPSYLNKILSGNSNMGYKFFSFITLSMSCHSLLAWRVSIERSAVFLMGIPLCVICCFPIAAFNFCSLCLIFVNLINMCLGVFRIPKSNLPVTPGVSCFLLLNSSPLYWKRHLFWELVVKGLVDLHAATAAKLLRSCLTLCDPIDGSPPGSAVPGILQARTLEWVAISFSIVWKWKWSCSIATDS